jgi:hypothetical protein
VLRRLPALLGFQRLQQARVITADHSLARHSRVWASSRSVGTVHALST